MSAQAQGSARYVALSGGVGGSKLSLGLAHLLGERLTVIVNTGDDFEHLGLHISPDVDTAIYTLAATATRNPALMLASGTMGALFGLQRRATGGIQAPVLTHLTWSTLMLRFLPALVDDPPPVR